MATMDTSPKTEAEKSRERRRQLGRECADRLIRARIAAGLSESEAARACGLTRSTWQEYEDGAIPDAVRGGRIEDALGVPRGSIYHDVEAPPVAHTASDFTPPPEADGPRVARDEFSQVEG